MRYPLRQLSPSRLPLRTAIILPAFTLVEMLVVMAIIVVLVGTAIVAGTSLLNSARGSATRSMMQVVSVALEDFRANPPKFVSQKWGQGGSKSYQSRYGKYPPDELEVFAVGGLMSAGGGQPLSLIKQGWNMFPNPDAGTFYSNMKFIQSTNPAEMQFEHRDLAAMYLTIELYTESAATILEKVSERYWVNPLAANNQPLQFVDRNNNGQFDNEDVAVRYLVDDWRIPITYMSQRDFNKTGPQQVVAGGSSNGVGWNQFSSEVIPLNDNKPILMSYGPDGRDQLTQEVMQGTAAASIQQDWIDNSIDRRINNPLNTDNIFLNERLMDRLITGAPQ